MKEIRFANETRRERGGGPFVYLGRRPDLLDATFVHDGEPIAHRKRLALIVRDVDKRNSHLTLETLQDEQHALPQFEVERAKRLIQKKHFRARDKRPCESNPLALSSRKLMGKPLLVARHGDLLKLLTDTRRD